MKKLVVFMFITVFMLAGCGKESSDNGGAESDAPKDNAAVGIITGSAESDLIAFAEKFAETFDQLAEDLNSAKNADEVAAAFDKSAASYGELAAMAKALEERYGEEELEKIAGSSALAGRLNIDKIAETSDIQNAVISAMSEYGESPVVVKALERWQEAAESMDIE